MCFVIKTILFSVYTSTESEKNVLEKVLKTDAHERYIVLLTQLVLFCVDIRNLHICNLFSC